MSRSATDSSLLPHHSLFRLALGLFLLLAVASVAPIRSYDYFWHLATGRWIVDNGRLPEDDPFAVASDRERWINGEWAFQLAVYGAHRIGGHAGISFLRGIAVAALFTLVFLAAQSLQRARVPSAERRVDRPPVTNGSLLVLLVVICWVGADHRLTPRPEAAATFLVVLCCWFALRRPSPYRVAVYLGLTVLWINVHPSALLSPVIAACGLPGARTRREAALRVATIAGAGLALLVNPHGLQGVLAPVRLMRTIGERRFINLEWLPSRPADFPLLYVVIGAGIVALLVWARPPGMHVTPAVLFALFAFLAIRHVRNQGFFFAVTPLVLSGALPVVRVLFTRALLVASGLMYAAFFAVRLPLTFGVDQRLFPVRSVERLRQSGAAGNIFNADQFGGYLIWTFYPERRVLTDGRNELFDDYLREYEHARRDGRAWQGLIAKYDVALAVEEYRPPLEVVDAASGSRRFVPAQDAYFPPRQWALIASDSVAMIFARRDRVPQALVERLEIQRPVLAQQSEKFPR